MLSRLAQPDRASPPPPKFTLNDTVLALSGDAFACHGNGRLTEAIAIYERILSFKELPVIHNNLGLAYAQTGRHDSAMIHYRRAVALKPDYTEALCNWGVSLSKLDRADEAEAKFRRAIEIDSRFAGAHHNLGILLRENGRLHEATSAIKQAIRHAPRNTYYYENLASVRTFKAGDRYLVALEDMAKDCASLDIAGRTQLHFALAKAYDDIGTPESAFAQFSAGNRLKRQETAYDEASTLARFGRIREVFTRELIRSRMDCGEQSRLPIFIIGMPRSGTTLIEQILASHPQIFGAGELTLLDQSVGALSRTLPGAPPCPEMASAMSREHFRRLGASYLDRLVQYAPGASHIVDKMPGNFLLAGFIHLALPNATIIHAVRDPVDTCISCFSLLFVDQKYTYDLAELGRYYRHYQALMAHWHSVLPPGRIMDVRYEDLVGGPESAARRILAHCGLPWDPKCLDFHRTKRPVRTASVTQVRRPIYKSSVGRWRKYEKFLGPLLAELACSI